MRLLCTFMLACALLAPQGVQAAKIEQPGYPAPPPAGQIRTIQDTIYGVLRTHRTLRSLLENQQVLTHEVSRARAGFGPRVDLHGAAGGSQYSDSGTRKSGLDQQMWGYLNASAKLVQPIWDGFASRSRVRSAKSTLESVQSRVFDTATSLSLDGIIAHIDLIRRREIYRLSQENVAKHKSIVEMQADRSQGDGMVDTVADLYQAQTRLQRALSSESEARASLLVAEETYKRLTGMEPGKLQAISWPPEVFSDPESVYALAEKYNPKLAAYLSDIRAARADRELAESAFYPVFNAEVGPTYTDRGGAKDRWIYSFDVLGTVSWNIFNSGADVAEYRAASARIRQARQIMNSYIDDLKLDIESTWTNYKAAEEQYKHYYNAVQYNKETLRLYEEQRDATGQRRLLDVLDSQSEMYNNSTQQWTSWGNILVGAYRLTALTGNMLPSMSIDTGPLKDAPPVDPDDKREHFDLGWFN